MKRINSCEKGKRIEREACRFLTSIGFPAERGARNGVKGGADIMCPTLDNLHIECKGDQSIDIGTRPLMYAVLQATQDATEGKLGIVLWKRKRGQWCLSKWVDGWVGTFRAHEAILEKWNTGAGVTA